MLPRRIGVIAEAVVHLASQVIQAAFQPAYGVVYEHRAGLTRIGTVRSAVTSEARSDAARGGEEVGAAALVVAPDDRFVQRDGGARAGDGENDAEDQGCSGYGPSPSDAPHDNPEERHLPAVGMDQPAA
jgi:hypothetical protein